MGPSGTLKIGILGIVATVAAASALAGCASRSVDAIVAHMPADEKLAVVSLLPQRPGFSFVGLTVFTNKRVKLKVKGWHINSYTTNVVSRYLATGPYRPVRLESSRFLEKTGAATMNVWSALVKTKSGIEPLVEAAKAKGAQALLIIGQGNVNGSARPDALGYGVHESAFSGSGSKTFVALDMWLINMQTGAQSPATRCQDIRSRPAKYHIEKPEDFSRENAEYTRSAVRKMIRKAAAQCLTEMHLYFGTPSRH